MEERLIRETGGCDDLTRRDVAGLLRCDAGAKDKAAQVIVLGIIILLIGYLAPVPAFVITIGWIVLVIGLILLVLGAINRPVGGRRYWY